MDTIDQLEILQFYTKIDCVWEEGSAWYNHSRLCIKTFVHEFIDEQKEARILNVGSGGSDYGLTTEMCHIDIAENKIKDKKDYIVASAENIPLEDLCADTIICVGSVINYCDPVRVIYEFQRLLKPHGSLLLEFESSYAFEYADAPNYGEAKILIECEYAGQPHRNYVFNECYIQGILASNGFSISKKHYFHTLSSLALHCGIPMDEAGQLGSLDKYTSETPKLRRHSGNIFMACKKGG